MNLIKTLLFCFLIYPIFLKAQAPEQNQNQTSVQSFEAGKTAQFPVSLYQGHASAQIPIFEMQANGISLPIQLEYDAGGVRVNQQPGWVGQNWKLNAGGAVVRSMKGSPDEEGFFLNASYQNSRNAYFTVVLDGQFLTETKTDTESELRQFAIDRFFTNNKTSDTEPDIFSFSLPDGRSGKFFLATDTTWKVISDHNFRIVFDITDTTNYLNPPFSEVPGSEGQQIYEKTIEGFKILDDMGNQYTFGFHSEAIEYSLPFFSQTHDQPFYPNWMANTWYLTEIKDYLGNNAYSLSYQRDFFTGQLTHGPVVRNFECRLFNGNWLNPTNEVSPEYMGSLISPVYLSAINNIEGQSLGFYRTNVTEIDTSLNIDKVEAQYDDVIDKVCPGGCTSIQPLPFLQESGYYSFNPTAALVDPFQGLKRKKLEQLFIYQNSQLLFGVKLKYNDVMDKRLRLDSVMVMDNTFPFNGAAMSHCYVLEYDDFDQLPGYLSNNVDHYGYNTGQPYNYQTVVNNFSNVQWDSLGLAHYNSRSSDFNFAKIGSLKKIIYPHGGRSELEYELHSYSQVLSDDRQSLINESGSIGGLRIKNIRDYKDQLTNFPTTIKSYKYVSNYASGGSISSGILGLKPKYHWVDWLSPTDEHPTGGYREDVFSVNNMLPMSNFFEAHIAYPEVTEVVNDSFYMTHKYTSHMEIKDELPYATLTFNQFSPYLNYNDKSFMRGKLKESLYFDKSNALVKKDQVYYHMDAIVSEDYGITCSAGFTYSCSPVIFDDKVYKGSANRIYFQKFYVDSSRSAQYFAGDSITQSIAFSYVQPSFYGNNYLFKNVETTNNSDGKNHSQISNYVFQPGIAPSGQQTFYDQLVTAHRLAPPVIVAKLVGINVVDGHRTLFNTFNTKILPAITQRYEYTWDENQTGSGSWADHQNILSYNNTFITPISVQAKGFQANTLSLNPRGKPLSNQYLTHSTSFSYNALDLLQQETAVDGTYSTYSYDLFSRVKERTLLPINATQRTKYHYAEHATDKSFIRHTSHFVPVADSGLDSIPTISYIDGLARTEQSIDIGGGSVPNQDVVAPMTYDFYHRPERQYNPISAVGNNGNFFAFNTNAPSTISRYEANALNRLASQTPPSWFATALQYGVNTSADAVIGYSSGSLYKQMATDPDGVKKITFTDKQGRLILSRQEKGSDKADTYYEYDDKNRCVRILPPGATTSDANLIFNKRYDGNDNLIYIKKPDAFAETFLYNQKDLPAVHRNGMLNESNQWLVFLYDDFGRMLKKGLYNGTSAPSNLENPTMNTVLEEYFYDGFDGNTTNAAPIYKGKIRKTKTRVLTDDGSVLWEEMTYSYDNAGRISQTIALDHLGHTETSDFTYDGAGNVLSMQRQITGLGITDQRNYTYDHRGRLIDVKANPNNTGLKTLSNHAYNFNGDLAEKNLGKTSSAYLQSLDYSYDSRYWLTGINDLVDGLVVENGDPCSLGSQEQISTSSMVGDGDIFAQKLYYNNGPAPGIPAVKNGHVAGQAWFHAHTGRNNQTYAYTYDFLHRVTSATQGEIKANVYSTQNHYSENFEYDVRGNILGLDRKGMVSQSWINGSCFASATIDSLAYNYASGTNRLVQVSDAAPCADTLQLPPLLDRDMIYAADDILVNASSVIGGTELQLEAGDEITVFQNLQLQNNALVYARQVPCPQAKYSEGFNQQSVSGQYLYNAAGNLIYDPNKKLTFAYNYLNLPYRIIGEENDTLFFTYNAGGTLLQKRYVRDSVVIDKVDYLGNIEIRDSNVILYHEDGRIRRVGSSWKYDYYIKDHLGNIRVVFEDVDGNEIISPEEIKARYDYYSFGMMHAGNGLGYLANDQKENFGYNGKEQAEEMNADLLLYGARQMDGTLGRFLVPDMMAEAKPDMNPYRYGFNSPMNYIDPVGLFESKKAARAYAREHGIYTGWFGRNKIVENSDGSYSIDNRKRHSSVRDYGTGIGIVEGAIAETRGVHLRDIGTEGMAALNDIGSERYNPDAYVVTEPLDIAYAAGVYVGLASASGRIFKGAGIVKELPKIGLTNAELVQRAATFADDFVPFTKTPGVTGTLKHEAATTLLKRYQNIYGNKGLDFKVRLNGSIIDILDNANNKIYDWKFGIQGGKTVTELNKSPQMIRYQKTFGLPTQIIRP